jgi:glycine/D-amino acid oxidase-like deaminating enzyme
MRPSPDVSGTMPVAIVGAGIIGLSLAVQLQREGQRVTVIDAGEPGGGASYGNAGFISQGSIFPPASLSLLKKLPSMLLDPDSPLAIRPSYLTHLLPWGLRLLLALRTPRLRRIIEALAAMNRQAIPAYRNLLSAAQAEDLLVQKGSLLVCRYGSTLSEKAALIPTYRENGIVVEKIDRDRLLGLEPSLSANLAGGLYFPTNAHCVDPGELCIRFARSVVSHGGQIFRAEVARIFREGDAWRITTPSGDLFASRIVVAAGHRSGSLLTTLGLKVPLASERGYHLMLPTPGLTLTRPVVMAEPFFAATPMQNGMRLAGTVEFANADAPPDFRRSTNLYKLALPYLPGLKNDDEATWMGIRPSLPDALPAIGRSFTHPNLYYSFGHQHVGLTQAAASAQLLTDVILNRPSFMDAAPFGLERFG